MMIAIILFLVWIIGLLFTFSLVKSAKRADLLAEEYYNVQVDDSLRVLK